MDQSDWFQVAKAERNQSYSFTARTALYFKQKQVIVVEFVSNMLRCLTQLNGN